MQNFPEEAGKKAQMLFSTHDDTKLTLQKQKQWGDFTPASVAISFIFSETAFISHEDHNYHLSRSLSFTVVCGLNPGIKEARLHISLFALRHTCKNPIIYKITLFKFLTYTWCCYWECARVGDITASGAASRVMDYCGIFHHPNGLLQSVTSQGCFPVITGVPPLYFLGGIPLFQSLVQTAHSERALHEWQREESAWRGLVMCTEWVAVITALVKALLRSV